MHIVCILPEVPRGTLGIVFAVERLTVQLVSEDPAPHKWMSESGNSGSKVIVKISDGNTMDRN